VEQRALEVTVDHLLQLLHTVAAVAAVLALLVLTAQLLLAAQVAQE
jgi:hypothetical protein